MNTNAKRVLPSVKVWDSTLKLLKGEQNRRYQESDVEPTYAEMVDEAVRLWLATPASVGEAPTFGGTKTSELPSYAKPSDAANLDENFVILLKSAISAIIQAELAKFLNKAKTSEPVITDSETLAALSEAEVAGIEVAFTEEHPRPGVRKQSGKKANGHKKEAVRGAPPPRKRGTGTSGS